MDKDNLLQIEVAYATPLTQKIITLKAEPSWTLEQAIQESGILNFYPEIDLSQQKVGVFSQQKKLTDLIKAGDRIEIYRPLAMDPKEARRLRAKK